MGTSFLASATSAAAAMPTCPWASRWHLAPLPIRGERAVGGRVGGRDWPRGDTCRSWRWGPGRSRTGLRLWVNVPLTYKTSFDADRQGVEDFGRHARCRPPLAGFRSSRPRVPASGPACRRLRRSRGEASSLLFSSRSMNSSDTDSWVLITKIWLSLSFVIVSLKFCYYLVSQPLKLLTSETGLTDGLSRK